jgi:precorrin-2 dehydrogenase/sirohydrochlorin ferrochelatase
MFPVVLDVIHVPVLLVGNGIAAARRLQLLDEAGAKHVTVFANTPSDELRALAGRRLVAKLPEVADFQFASIVMIADLEENTTARLAQQARNAGALVNTEDNRKWCDFHVPAIVRRGDLLLTVSTGGKSPRLARLIRRLLAEVFSESWSERLKQIGARRKQWREEGAQIPQLAARTDALLEQEGWLREVQEKVAQL